MYNRELTNGARNILNEVFIAAERSTETANHSAVCLWWEVSYRLALFMVLFISTPFIYEHITILYE